MNLYTFKKIHTFGTDGSIDEGPDDCCSLAYAPEPLLTLGLVFLRYQRKCRRKAKRELGQQLSSKPWMIKKVRKVVNRGMR